jgi:hypothetical protein
MNIYFFYNNNYLLLFIKINKFKFLQDNIYKKWNQIKTHKKIIVIIYG